MKLKKRSILTSIMILFVFSSFSLASAAEGWILEENDNYYYYVEIEQNGANLAKGIVSFIVDDITATTIRFSINAEFTGSDGITYRDLFENYDDVDILTSALRYTIFYRNPYIFMKEDYVDTIASLIQSDVDSYEIQPEYIVEANLGDSEWYYKLTRNGTDYLFEQDWKYTPEGILKSYRYHYINTDNTLEQEIFIEKSILPFKLPIAVPNLYVYIAAGVLGLVIILIVGAIFRKKKK